MRAAATPLSDDLPRGPGSASVVTSCLVGNS